MGVLTYGPLSSGWLSGRADPAAGHRAATVQRSFDMSLPANQRRAEVVAGLAGLVAQAGISLPHLAGLRPRHPAVTAVLIGPRTPGQLDDLLRAADVTLPAGILDRIDDLVPPGTEVNPADRRRRRTRPRSPASSAGRPPAAG
jgi:aryl-alcohol dehydrogenase-like predicted oxidoreductase